MAHTVNRWTQDTPNPDGQIFLGASEFLSIGTAPTLSSTGAGLLALSMGATATLTLYSPIAQLIRTGVLATPNLTQRQFGTAAAVPGPSGVAGTSGPGGQAGYPPFVGSTIATLAGSAGGVGKGLQINWIDLCYSVTTNNLTVAQVGLTKTVYKDAAAPVVTNLLALGTNGLSLVAAATPHRIRVTPTTIAMVTSDGSQLILQVNFTSGAGGGLFYGAILGVSFNYN